MDVIQNIMGLKDIMDVVRIYIYRERDIIYIYMYTYVRIHVD